MDAVHTFKLALVVTGIVLQCSSYVLGKASENDQDSVKSCPLLPTMDITMCNFHGEALDNEEIVPEKTLHEGTLPEGTLCLLGAEGEDLIFLKCTGQTWKETAEHGVTSPGLSRTKRSTGVNFSWNIPPLLNACVFVCEGKIANSPPSISCPKIPSKLYADKAERSKKVMWNQAVAHDKENGDLSTHVTSGWGPGSVLTDGSYFVTYIAKDGGGKIDTCTKYFSVKVRRCPSDRTFLENGQATCSAYTLYGSRCSYTCSPGFELSGSTFSECQRNSVWKNSKPTCKKVVCGSPPAVPHGKLLCTDNNYNDTCGVTCTDDGYSLQGASIIKCQRNKTWTQPGLCVDIKPPVLQCSQTLVAYAQPHLTHNTVDWKMPNTSDNSGQSVAVTSDPKPGSNFTLGTHQVMFTGIDTSGIKSVCYMSVLLKEIRCDFAETIISFADTTCSQSNAVGSECNVECHHGYVLEGDVKRKCQENGTWSGKPAKCKSISCQEPPVISHGHYDCPDGQEFQDICLLICDDGYKTADPFVITCQISGNWTSAGYCYDVEPPVFPYGCPADIKTHAGPLGTSASVIYEYPVVTENSGEDVTITAEPESGSEFSLGVTEITITATDLQGIIATCQFHVIVKEISCQKPDFDSTGKYMEYDCPDNFVYGANCSLMCLDGNPVQGPSLITCDKTGTDEKLSWTWSGDVVPYCKSEVCPKLKTPKHGSLICSHIFGTKDQQCIVQCDDQFMYPKTAPEIFMCFQSVGEWSPEGPVPDCYERRKPKRFLAKITFSYLSSSCNDQSIEIKTRFSTVLNTALKSVCKGRLKCNINEVTISCSSYRRKKRTVDVSSIRHEILVQIDLGDYKDRGSPSETMEYYNEVVEQINLALILSAEQDIFNIPEIGTFESLDYAQPVFTCDSGEILVQSTLSCSGCGAGHTLDNSTNSCIPCPRGSYQSNESSTSCIQCPERMSTANTMSVSEDQCFFLCRPGEVSSTGLEPCFPCQKGSYQENVGMTECDLCPFGMMTSLESSGSSSDCLYYNVRMDSDTSHAIIQLPDPNLKSFTFLMWVHSVSSNQKQVLDFSLEKSYTKNTSAYFSLGSIQLFVTASDSGNVSSIRKWYHVAFVYVNETSLLYVNGKEVMRMEALHTAEFTNKEFIFSPSDSIKSILISGVQMTSSGLEDKEVQEFSTSCNRQVEKNILGASEREATLVNPSTCDDVNDCKDGPCGEFGTCIDKLGRFVCVCDEPWSGDHCQVVPDFCLDHSCAEWSTCLNDPRNKTYICTCPSGYAGNLCHDNIVNGNWGTWEEWGPCSVACGSGQRSRIRECSNPPPNHVGQYCPGNGTETEKCEERPCAVDGQWSEWSLWTYSATCGKVTAFRQRTCNNPAPSHGGNPCLGPEFEFQTSENKICPVDGMFGLWSEWSQCSATCGGGSSSRHRVCDSPPPAHGGVQCNVSQAVETRSCSVQNCPKCKKLNTSESYASLNCVYDQFVDMTVCHVTCNHGLMMVPNDLNEFQCGRLTNYTWSHQTKDNPTGILLRCTDAKIPSSQKTSLNIHFDINCQKSPPILEFENSLNSKLEQEIKCKDIAGCSINIQTSLSCGQQKQSPGFLNVVVDMEISHAGKHSEYLSTLSESEINAEMNRLQAIESMTLQLINQSSKIYQINVQGTTYNGKISSVKADVKCPQDGSGFLEGVCVNCPPGSYSDGKGACVRCGKGFYQNQARMTSCVQCPEGLTTSGIGFSSQNDCQADQPDYKDYFYWMYDDVHEDATKDRGQFHFDNTLTISVISVLTFFIILFTITTVSLVRKYKSKKQKLTLHHGSKQDVYQNEVYQMHEKHYTDSQENLDANIYYEIGLELEKEVKELKKGF